MNHHVTRWINFIGILELLLGISALFQIDYFPDFNLEGKVGYVLRVSGIILGIGLFYLNNLARLLVILQMYFFIINLLYYNIYINKIQLEVRYLIISLFLISYVLILRYLLSRKIRSYFVRSINGIVTLSQSEANKLKFKAYAGLGKIFREQKSKQKAVDYFIKAKKAGYQLSNDELIYSGNYFSEGNDKGPNAIQIYLDCIRLFPEDQKDVKLIYSFLEEQCKITSSSNTIETKKKEELLDKVLYANPNIGWANYYKGFGCFKRSDFAKAVIMFRKACEFDYNKPLVYYWLGMSHLEHSRKLKISNLDDSVQMFKTFIESANEHDSTKFVTEICRANFELAKAILPSQIISNAEFVATESQKKEFTVALNNLNNAININGEDAEFHFYSGRILSLLNDSEKAISELKKAVELNSSKKEYLYLLAFEYRKVGDFSKCLEYVIKATDIDNEYIDALKLQLLVLFHERKFEDAEILVIKILKINSTDQLSQLLYIQILYHLEKYEETVEQFKKIEGNELKSEYQLQATFCAARSFSKLGQYIKAISLYTLLPEDYKCCYHLGCAWAVTGNNSKAIHAFNRVIEKYDIVLKEKEARSEPFTSIDEHEEYHKQEKKEINSFDQEYLTYAEKSYLHLGHLSLQSNNISQAEDYYRKAFSINPDRLENMTSLGLLYFNKGDNDRSKSYFLKALVKDKNNKLANLGIGLIYEKENDITNAIKSYEIANQNDFGPDQSKIRLGILYCREGEYQKSIDLLEPNYKTQEVQDAVLFYLGLNYARLERFTEAIICWGKLKDKFPEDEKLDINVARLHYLFGYYHLQSNNFKEAILHWNEYLLKYPDDENTHKSIAEMYFRESLKILSGDQNGNINLAFEFINKAVELSQENYKYSFYLGLIEMQLGHLENSRQILNSLKGRISDSRLNYHLGLLYFKNGDFEKGESMIKEIIHSDAASPYYNRAISVLSNEYIKNGEINKAISLLEANYE